MTACLQKLMPILKNMVQQNEYHGYLRIKRIGPMLNDQSLDISTLILFFLLF
jgi:hypothetical protein